MIRLCCFGSPAAHSPGEMERNSTSLEKFLCFFQLYKLVSFCLHPQKQQWVVDYATVFNPYRVKKIVITLSLIRGMILNYLYNADIITVSIHCTAMLRICHVHKPLHTYTNAWCSFGKPLHIFHEKQDNRNQIFI